jgi:adenine-specific DNA-methyltransferase
MWIKPTYREIFRVLKPDSFCISTYGWHCPEYFFNAWQSAGFVCVGHIVWVKPYTSGQRYLRYQHEQAVLLAKGSPRPPREPMPDVIPWEYSGNKFHPTEKPVSALSPLIRAFSRPGDIILDPFCGSGSTLIAAAELRRRFIGIEIEQRYSQAAQERLTRRDSGRQQ